MNETVLHSLPSTGDLRTIAGGQDMVEAILTGARRRYKRHSSKSTYIERNGAVCAVGAVCKEVGAPNLTMPATNSLSAFSESLIDWDVEREMADAAKKAIDLLNRSANKLYRNEIGAIRRVGTHWTFPLEILNQGLGRRAYRKAVLACYDDAIAERAKANAKRGS